MDQLQTGFHMKIDKTLKKQLLHLRNGQTVSALIQMILSETVHLLEKKECELHEMLFKGEEAQTEDLYIIMDDVQKGKLFQIQSHFRLKSKAVILRFLLRIYIAKLARYGQGILKKCLQRSHTIWEIKKTRRQRWGSTYRETAYMLCSYGKDLHLQEIFFCPTRDSS